MRCPKEGAVIIYLAFESYLLKRGVGGSEERYLLHGYINLVTIGS